MNNAIDLGTDKEDSALPEFQRLRIFIGIQVFFLILSPFCGGFHYRTWSMLDTALMIGSIGVTALVPVLETRKARSITLRIAIVIYLAAIIDMSVNVLVSGWLGWKPFRID